MCIIQTDPSVPPYEWRIREEKIYFNMPRASYEANRYVECKLQGFLNDGQIVGDQYSEHRDDVIIKCYLLSMIVEGKFIEYPLGTLSLDLKRIGVI